MEFLHTEIDFLNRLNKSRKIYIYGAGKIGKLLSNRLMRYQIRISGYIETSPTVTNVNEIPVLSISSVDMDNESNPQIIVATTKKYRSEILNILEKYKDVFIVSDHLIRRMTMITQKNLLFQTHIVEHCNLNCRGCYHFSPLASEEYLSVQEYTNDVKRLSTLFEGKMERVLLLGGEPLLHPQIIDFFYVTRKYFPKGDIQILTNGLLLLQMDKKFYSAMRDYNIELWVTKYPVNFDYARAEEVALHHGVKLNYFSHEPVRSLGHQPLDITGKQDWLQNFNCCYRADECIDLKHGRLYSCIIPAEIRHFCSYFKIDISIEKNDYVDIYQVSSAEELLERLCRPMPFCRYCNRDEVEVFGVHPWEKTKYRIDEWTQ